MALCKKGEKMKKFTHHKRGIKNIKNLFTIHILHVLKSLYKNNDPLSKNSLKRYVFNPFLKPVKDGDLRKSNGSGFHSLRKHTEKALSPYVFVNDRGCSNSCLEADRKFLECD